MVTPSRVCELKFFCPAEKFTEAPVTPSRVCELKFVRRCAILQTRSHTLTGV